MALGVAGHDDAHRRPYPEGREVPARGLEVTFLTPVSRGGTFPPKHLGRSEAAPPPRALLRLSSSRLCPRTLQIRRQRARMEAMRRDQEAEREAHEREVQKERHLVWRNRTAVRLLGTSVDGLFLFFTQRVANLAGSRRVHNDALRRNGEGRPRVS